MERDRRYGSPVEEEVRGVEEGVEGVDLSVGEGLGSWLSSSIILSMYASCDFLPRSYLLGTFVTSSDVFSMFIFSKNQKD